MQDYRQSKTLYTPAEVAEDWKLPSFVCIGAPKCATTWLFACMSEHPRVFSPDFKEINFFRVSRWGDDYTKHGVEYYARLFDDASDGAVIGDFSPNLLEDPYAPERVLALLPGARLIVMLRNPIDRAHSHYYHVQNRATQARTSLRQVLDDPSLDHAGYLTQGLYGEQLERWMQVFSPEQFLVLTLDEVERDPLGTFRRACEHVGAPTDFVPSTLSRKVNQAKKHRVRDMHRVSVRVGRFLASNGLDPIRIAIKRTGLPQLIRSLNEIEQTNPPLAARDRADLVAFYREDNARLSALLGRDFSGWLEKASR